MSPPVVLVASDIRTFDGYVWHCAPATYLEATLARAGALPLILTAFGDRIDFDAVLARVDGVVVTGSKTNVYPPLYGVPADPSTEPYDHDRDATTLPLIRRAIALGVPLLCICRGIQELNVALGGTLASEIQEMDGRMDHRSPEADTADERFALRHAVTIAAGGCLGRIVDDGGITVNSLHRQAVGRLADRLRIEAQAPDGTIEAVSVTDAPGFTLGVQWHPEYWAASDGPSGRIFGAFGDAARAYAAARAAQP